MSNFLSNLRACNMDLRFLVMRESPGDPEHPGLRFRALRLLPNGNFHAGDLFTDPGSMEVLRPYVKSEGEASEVLQKTRAHLVEVIRRERCEQVYLQLALEKQVLVRQTTDGRVEEACGSVPEDLMLLYSGRMRQPALGVPVEF